MKPIKMLGLAMLAALMAMAFVGASSATAETTTLCSSDSEPSEENTCGVEHVHETTLSGAGQAVLLSSSLTVKCDVLFLGDTLGEGSGAPLIIHGSFTYSNCNNSCTATEENGPAEIKVLKEGSELASVTGEGLVHLVCSGFINCRYNGTGLKGHGLGPLTSSETNGSTTLSEQTTNKESGTLCPSTAKLDITTTPLEPTYIGGALLHYCVDYGKVNGLYNDSACTEQAGAQNKLYELVVAKTGFKVGEVLCVNKRTLNGLWKKRTSGICEEDNAANTSLYEKGTITAIKD